MRVVVTGSSGGIGRQTAKLFVERGFEVFGIDIASPTLQSANYTHYIADVRASKLLPDIDEVSILINNAGIQTPYDNGFNDIETNLVGLINTTRKYGIQHHIRAIVNVASASAHSGAEFPAYAASKGGVLAYTKNTALKVAKWGATCNSISPGGVTTDTNRRIIEDEATYAEVLNETILGKWASPQEIAEWIYFVAVVNKSMTAQDILIDNGEMAKSNFVWR